MMSKGKLRLLVFGLLVSGAAVSSVVAARGRQGSTYLEGPATWVPFSAKFKYVVGGSETRGLVARASNGSERQELYGPTGELQALTIQNIPQQAMYRMLAGSGQYEQRTIVLPQAGYLPKRKMSLDSSNLVSKTAIKIGEWMAWETASQLDEATHSRIFVAPDLNFFAIRIVEQDWRRDTLDLALGEPDPSLFLLPRNATITQTGGPMRLGIFTPQEMSGVQQGFRAKGPVR
jgi:hypothetical protein